MKARIIHPGTTWRTRDFEVHPRRPMGKPRIVVKFGPEITVELRRNQAIDLANAIADALEHDYH